MSLAEEAEQIICGLIYLHRFVSELKTLPMKNIVWTHHTKKTHKLRYFDIQKPKHKESQEKHDWLGLHDDLGKTKC